MRLQLPVFLPASPTILELREDRGHVLLCIRAWHKTVLNNTEQISKGVDRWRGMDGRMDGWKEWLMDG